MIMPAYDLPLPIPNRVVKVRGADDTHNGESKYRKAVSVRFFVCKYSFSMISALG